MSGRKPPDGFVRLNDLSADHAEAARATCRARVTESNRKGREEWGRRWGPDIIPCVNDGLACRECVPAKEG